MSAEREAAEERLLEASLRSLLGREAGVQREPSRRSMWLVAACVALGLGVVGATMWLQHSGGGGDGANVPAQDSEPGPLPDEVTADATTLSTLPRDTQNLRVRVPGPRDLFPLTRFMHLRRLQILSDQSGAGALPDSPHWKSPALRNDEQALTFLGCTSMDLEVIELPSEFVLCQQHLKPVETYLSRLHTLKFHGGKNCNRALAEALGRLPALRTLIVAGSAVDAGFFEALATRPIRALALRACPGLDADAWNALAHMRSLQHLEVTFQNGGTTGIEGTAYHLGTLGGDAFDTFAALPALRELLLDESDFDDTMLPRLPDKLERLDLGDRPMKSSLTASALRRLGKLRDLTFGCGLDPTAAIDLLGALRLRRLDYRGKQFSPELLRAIAEQPDLTELSLKVTQSPVDYSPLVHAPRLESLRIIGGGSFSAQFEHLPTVDDLKPLRACKTLRRVRFTNCGLDLGDYEAALGPAIQLTAHEFL